MQAAYKAVAEKIPNVLTNNLTEHQQTQQINNTVVLYTNRCYSEDKCHTEADFYSITHRLSQIYLRSTFQGAYTDIDGAKKPLKIRTGKSLF